MHTGSFGLGITCGGRRGHGFELCAGKGSEDGYTLDLFLVCPRGGWLVNGTAKLRLRVDLNCGDPGCGSPSEPRSCRQCTLQPFPGAENALSAVTLNGKMLTQNKNVSNLWASGRDKEPFSEDRYVAFDVPISVLVGGINRMSMNVSHALREVRQCIACGSAFPVITHIDMQVPVKE